MKPTILLADDHTLVRKGLRLLIEENSMATVVGEAVNGIEALRLATELQPDLVLMDLTMPEMNGMDATRQIIRKYPGIRVLVLSMEIDRFFVVEALKAGATGYLLKDSADSELAEAIRSVAAGETWLPQKVLAVLIKDFLQCIPEDMSMVYRGLTPREREILQLLADGRCTKEIAFAIGSCKKTVENQRQIIMKKLQLFSVAELTKYAVRHGLTSLRT